MDYKPVPEADWKVFRKLREIALERFCVRILGEMGQAAASGGETAHERYLRVFRLLKKRDREIARAFDNPRRSQMLIQLATMYGYGLLEPEEMGQFSKSTREQAVTLAEG